MTLQSEGPRTVGADPTEREIAELAPWFHNLHLPSGQQTAPDHPLGDFPRFKWEQLAPEIPEDLTGAHVLDIGCNAGYYSFQLAARGATVLAIDSDEHYLRQARWAARELDPERRISFEQRHLYELGRGGEPFDVVLFLGVLYHLRYPLLALDLISRLVRGRLIVQTLTMPTGDGDGAEPPEDLPIGARRRMNDPTWPKAAFIEHRLAGDPTNWWAPDEECLLAMLRSAGMRVLSNPGHELFVCAPEDPARDGSAAMRAAELDAALGLQASQRK